MHAWHVSFHLCMCMHVVCLSVCIFGMYLYFYALYVLICVHGMLRHVQNVPK